MERIGIGYEKYNGFLPERWKELKQIARETLNDESTKKFLIEHTRSVEEYENLMRAIHMVANFEEVEWCF